MALWRPQHTHILGVVLAEWFGIHTHTHTLTCRGSLSRLGKDINPYWRRSSSEVSKMQIFWPGARTWRWTRFFPSSAGRLATSMQQLFRSLGACAAFLKCQKWVAMVSSRAIMHAHAHICITRPRIACGRERQPPTHITPKRSRYKTIFQHTQADASGHQLVYSYFISFYDDNNIRKHKLTCVHTTSLHPIRTSQN